MTINKTPCGKPDCTNTTTTCCEKRIDASCVYYHSCVTTPTKFTCLSIKNGASLESILETLDKQLCKSVPLPITWNLPCLRNKYRYVVTDFKTFAEAVDDRICKLEGEIITNLINNNSFINELINKITSNQNFINSVVNIVNNNCCEKKNCDLVVSVGTPVCTTTCIPVTAVTIAGNNTVNRQQIITYTATVSNATGYTWSVVGGTIMNGQNTSSITVLWGTNSTGSVQVTASGCNNSTVTATRAITIN